MNPESFDVTFGVRFIYSDLACFLASLTISPYDSAHFSHYIIRDPITAFSIQIAAILKFIINFASFIDYKL